MSSLPHPKQAGQPGGATLAAARRRPPWQAYLLALGCTGATLLLRFAIGPLHYPAFGAALFAFPILLSAGIGGFGPGVASTLAAVALVLTFPASVQTSPSIAFEIVTLLAAGLIVSSVAGRLKEHAAANRRSRLLGGLFIAAACAIVTAVAVFRSIESPPTGASQDRSILRLVAALHGLHQRSAAVEQDASDFAHTPDASHAATLRASLREEQASADLLGELLGPDPERNADLTALRAAVNDERRRLGSLLSARPAAAATAVPTPRPIELQSGDLDDLIERIEWMTLSDAEERASRAEDHNAFTRSVVLLGGGLASCLLVMGVFVIGADEAERRHSEEGLRSENEWLENAVRERTRELLETNRSLAASEERLQLFVRHVPAALAMFDTEMRYLTASTRWVEDHQMDAGPLRGRPHYDLFPDIPEAWKEIHRRALAGETLRSEREQVRRPDGSVQWLRWEVLPWHEADGRVGGILIFREDITERIETEESLRYHQQLLQETGHIAKVGGWEFDAVTGKGGWTEEVARIHDLDPAHPINRDEGIDFYEPGSRARIAEAVKRAVEQGVSYDLELQIVSASGVHKWVRTIGHPVVVDGRVVKVRGSFQDITAQKRTEEEIRRLNAELESRVVRRTAELEAANRELEAFSYSVSHDLRAPLRSVNGFARVLLEDFAPTLPQEARDCIARICNGASRMGQLIDDLLAFSRLSRAPLTLQPVDMNALVHSALIELQSGSDAARAEVRFSALHPCEGDPALLKQVWTNLLSNAFKYSSRRDQPVVEIGSAAAEGTVEYFVRDNGTGFDMRYAHKLFGVFQRLHRADEFEGTGVGLAIVQRIIHRHGGRVRAVAKPDQGATFFFTLHQSHVS